MCTLNIHISVYSTYTFSKNVPNSIHITYIFFQWIYRIMYIFQKNVYIEYTHLCIYTFFKEYKKYWFFFFQICVHWMFIFLYIQCIIFKNCIQLRTFNIHKFSKNVHNYVNSMYIFSKQCTWFYTFFEALFIFQKIIKPTFSLRNKIITSLAFSFSCEHIWHFFFLLK